MHLMLAVYGTQEPIENWIISDISLPLRPNQVTVNFVGETGFFQEPIIKDVTAYLKVISNPLESNAEIVRILNRDIVVKSMGLNRQPTSRVLLESIYYSTGLAIFTKAVG